MLDRYRALGSRTYRTDHDGALLLAIGSGGAISVHRYRAFVPALLARAVGES